MSDYTKVGTWTNVAKSGATIYAADFDAEFTALETAISSKADSSGVTDVSGLFSVEVITSSGTWTRPSGVKKVFVRVLAGGGGGCGGGDDMSGGGGGAGGYSEKFIDVTSIASSTVTVGAAGSAGGEWTAGGSGGTSSWDDGTNVITCGGGNVATINPRGGQQGGSATGGDVNIAGGDGVAGGDLNSYNFRGGTGASSPLGGGGGGGANFYSATNARGYGSGGGGGTGEDGSSYDSTAGAPGIVIVWEYK